MQMHPFGNDQEEENMTKMIKLPDVMEATALSRSSIYAFIKQGNFPQPIPLGTRAVGWDAAEIQNWIAQRAELRGVR